MIRLDSVALRYPSAEQPVLDDIDVLVPAGGFRWVLGPSGAGKTSLLRLLNLAVRPTAGRIELFGVATHRARRSVLSRLRRRTGTVFQDLRLLPELSVFDNVALRLRLDGVSESQVASEVTEMLRWIGLGRKLHMRPPELSGGERQRVAIARAVVHRPPLLLADEPTAALDLPQASRILQLFTDLNRLGSTVLVATHSEVLVERFPNPALRLDRGRLSADA
ncbi:MAG: ATP-binding cassette domain-containing protein [Gluconacetobacter diazotrophicus]|nr:ATP-binding cassette domain-containing protein [Gluconacetobacter diazotrophicus]